MYRNNKQAGLIIRSERVGLIWTGSLLCWITNNVRLMLALCINHPRFCINAHIGEVPPRLCQMVLCKLHNLMRFIRNHHHHRNLLLWSMSVYPHANVVSTWCSAAVLANKAWYRTILSQPPISNLGPRAHPALVVPQGNRFGNIPHIKSLCSTAVSPRWLPTKQAPPFGHVSCR